MNNQETQQITVSKPLFYGLVGVVGFLVIAVLYLLLNRPATPAPLPGGGSNQTAVPTQTSNQQTGYPSGIPEDTQVPDPTRRPTGPEDVASSFYNWYFTFKGDPLKSGAY